MPVCQPLVVELFCGSFGWSAGFLVEGWRAIGVDIEHLMHHGPVPEGADLILQDVRTLQGSQFRDADAFACSPPCQKYSYMAMPWKRGKAMAAEIRNDFHKYSELNYLFAECFRIQMEACRVAGRYIPIIVENVRGAQEWVGRSKWHYGSFHLWGDVPALMPITTTRSVMKRGVAHRSNGETNFHGTKHPGMNWSGSDKPGYVGQAFNGLKLPGNNCPRRWEDREVARLCDANTWAMHRHGGSGSRKAASAAIARIPFPLARHIARCFKP